MRQGSGLGGGEEEMGLGTTVCDHAIKDFIIMHMEKITELWLYIQLQIWYFLTFKFLTLQTK